MKQHRKNNILFFDTPSVNCGYNEVDRMLFGQRRTEFQYKRYLRQSLNVCRVSRNSENVCQQKRIHLKINNNKIQQPTYNFYPEQYNTILKHHTINFCF